VCTRVHQLNNHSRTNNSKGGRNSYGKLMKNVEIIANDHALLRSHWENSQIRRMLKGESVGMHIDEAGRQGRGE